VAGRFQHPRPQEQLLARRCGRVLGRLGHTSAARQRSGQSVSPATPGASPRPSAPGHEGLPVRGQPADLATPSTVAAAESQAPAEVGAGHGGAPDQRRRLPRAGSTTGEEGRFSPGKQGAHQAQGGDNGAGNAAGAKGVNTPRQTPSPAPPAPLPQPLAAGSLPAAQTTPRNAPPPPPAAAPPPEAMQVEQTRTRKRGQAGKVGGRVNKAIIVQAPPNEYSAPRPALGKRPAPSPRRRRRRRRRGDRMHMHRGSSPSTRRSAWVIQPLPAQAASARRRGNL
jgi:hypothetical protein